MASIISDKHQFILEASKTALHALISQPGHYNKDPAGLAKMSREYAIALWLAMRHPVE